MVLRVCILLITPGGSARQEERGLNVEQGGALARVRAEIGEPDLGIRGQGFERQSGEEPSGITLVVCEWPWSGPAPVRPAPGPGIAAAQLPSRLSAQAELYDALLAEPLRPSGPNRPPDRNRPRKRRWTGSVSSFTAVLVAVSAVSDDGIKRDRPANLAPRFAGRPGRGTEGAMESKKRQIREGRRCERKGRAEFGG